VDAGSRLAAAVGPELHVHCYHHQAVGRLADGLRAVAWSEDGVVEAVEPVRSAGWAVAVQAHPEESADRRLFAALVDACASSAPGGSRRRPGPERSPLSGQEAAQQRLGAGEVLGHRGPRCGRVPGEDRPDDGGVLVVRVLEVGGHQRHPVQQLVEPAAHVGERRRERR
jgi:hypothetical protein